jgi:hypothetical protein
MPDIPPLTSFASRELRRPRPIPAKLREAISLMVYGDPDDPDCRAFTFIEAAHETGIKPDVMRRYLDRPEVRALLLGERRAFRAAICGGNEGALLRVRETAQNGMAVVAAVRALEELEAPRDGRGVNVTVNTAVGVGPIRPGYVIRLPRYDEPPASSEPEPQPAGDAERR